MQRLIAVTALALLLSACSDQGPTDIEPPDRTYAIQDAVNGENGNPFVFLKPPVVDEPSSSLFGTFDPDVQPVVEVCVLDLNTDSCGSLLVTNDGSNQEASYTVDGGPGGESVTVDLVDEEYQVQIHFSLFDLQESTTYRIQMRVGDGVLAFADLEVVDPREMKNTANENSIVFTNDQKTLSWKTRIDEGALCFSGVTCGSGTVAAGQESTVTFTSSDGDEVDFHFPDGWSATVDGQTVDAVTITIDEVLAVHGTASDPSCFGFHSVNDPVTGDPSNCYELEAYLDGQDPVDVEFDSPFPILAFCPDDQVLQAIADGEDGWLMTSIEEDAQGQITRTYRNVDPAADFGGCPLPSSSVAASPLSTVHRFASALWDRVRPLMGPLLPKPLHAADIGFGGEVTDLSTIFFWSRTPDDVAISPSSTTLLVNETLALTVDPVFHDAGSDGSFAAAVTWSSADPTVASVDASGVVTAEAAGSTEVVAEVTNILDPDRSTLTDTASVTVDVALGAFGTATVDGVEGTGEWPSGSCAAVTFNLPGGGTTPGEFCFMNDQGTLYVRSTYQRTTDPASTLFVDLDRDGDQIVGADPGDDVIALQQNNGSGFFRDEVYFDDNTFQGVTCGSTVCATEDTQLGGTSDGGGAYANNSGEVVLEISHPLSSGDTYDVSLVAPSTLEVRFRQSIQDANNNSALTDLFVTVEIN